MLAISSATWGKECDSKTAQTLYPLDVEIRSRRRGVVFRRALCLGVKVTGTHDGKTIDSRAVGDAMAVRLDDEIVYSEKGGYPRAGKSDACDRQEPLVWVSTWARPRAYVPGYHSAR